jgi:hypothetical protein
VPPIVVVALLVAAAFLLGDGDPVAGVENALALATRGPRLSHGTLRSDGTVAEDIQALADDAGLTLECNSLARLISSEEGMSDTTTQAAVAWAVKNEAARQGISITDLLTRATGHYGNQVVNHYATTAKDPYDRDAQIAQQVLDGTIADFTGGATNFDRASGEKDPDAVAAKRMKGGLVLVDVPGADSGLRFWRYG